MKRASILLFPVVLVVSFGCQGMLQCAWSPSALSPEAEALAGARAAPAVEARYGGVVRDVQAERHMEGIGQRLTQAIPEIQGHYQYRLLSTDKLNAASLPSGRVYLTQGLYRRLQSDGQLAAVLAHEMAHLVVKDHFKPRCSSCQEALEREESADRRGVAYLRRAGIEPRAMIEVVQLIADVQPRGWSETRVRSLLRCMPETATSSVLARN